MDVYTRHKSYYTTIYEKYWAPLENKEKNTHRYEKYWAPFENIEHLPTDMRNTECLLRI